ncbi:carboxypeptidase C prc1 [Chamberlinius hualienensis]
MGTHLEQINRRIPEKFKDYFLQIYAMFEEIGYDEATQNRKMDIAAEKFGETIYRPFRRERDVLLEEVEKLGHEFLTMRCDLEITIPDPEESLSILELKSCLLEKNAVLGKLRDKRLSQYETLRKQNESFAKVLDCEPKALSFNVAPSEKQLQEYKGFLESQGQEIAKRKAVVAEMKPLLISLMNDMDLTLENEFQHDLLFGKEFILSEQNMTNLQQFKQLMESKAEKNKKMIIKLKETLSGLWSFLQVSSAEQVSFLDNFKGMRSFAVIQMLKKEISRCQELKLSNIEKYVKNVREEIEKHWNLLYYSEEQMKTFHSYNSNDFTESLLNEHERELNILKEKYNSGQEIYAAFKNRMDLWDKMKEMESKANDPKRFNNRGGKLLAEEKERSKLMNHLPKVEQKLNEMVSNWETTTGRRFSVFGESLPDFIRQQWDQREQEKENEKLERRAKNQQMMDDMLNGGGTGNRTTCKRPREPGSGTPLRPATAKMAKTNLLTPINSLTNIQMSSCGKLLPASTSKVLPTPSGQRGQLPPSRRLFVKKPVKGRMNRTRQNIDGRKFAGDETNPFSVSIESTNSEFQSNLRTRYLQDKHCRSSAVPSPSPIKTPSKQGGYRNRLGLPFLL